MKTIIIVVVLVTIATSTVLDGTLKTKDSWHFIGKFCFPPTKFGDKGYQNANFTINTSNKNLKVIRYGSDRFNEKRPGFGWDIVYENFKSGKMNCTEAVKQNFDEQDVKSGQPIHFFVNSQYRAYFWFFVVADCSATSIDITNYTISFTNPEYPDNWSFQFSYDRWAIPQIYITLLILYFVLLGAHGYGSYQLYRKEAYHPLVKILTASVALQFLSVLFQVIHYSIFAKDGRGAPGLFAFGELLLMASNLLLMFLCILLAKGWAITTNYLSQKNLVLIVMSVFTVGFIILFIWDNFGTDPAQVNYFYESPPGIIVLVLRCLLVLWFLWSIRDTLRLESLPERRKFYLIFTICYSAWFILLPFTVFICSFIDPFRRYFYIRLCSVIIDIFGVGALVVLLWPTLAQNYFTIRSTSQLLENKGVKNYDL